MVGLIDRRIDVIWINKINTKEQLSGNAKRGAFWETHHLIRLPTKRLQIVQRIDLLLK